MTLSLTIFLAYSPILAATFVSALAAAKEEQRAQQQNGDGDGEASHERISREDLDVSLRYIRMVNRRLGGISALLYAAGRGGEAESRGENTSTIAVPEQVRRPVPEDQGRPQDPQGGLELVLQDTDIITKFCATIKEGA